MSKARATVLKASPHCETVRATHSRRYGGWRNNPSNAVRCPMVVLLPARDPAGRDVGGGPLAAPILKVPVQGKVKPGWVGDAMRIGELAQASGITTKTLRFYEATGLLPPAERTASGYRDFTRDTLGRLDFIRRGRAAGLSLAQVRQVLDIADAGRTPCRHVHSLLGERLTGLDRQIADLQALRAAVAQLRDTVAVADPDPANLEQGCPYL